MEEDKKEKVAWNLAQHIIIELSGLLQNASLNYIAGNYSKAFSNLRACRLRITDNLNKEEKDNLTKIENSFLLQLRKSRSIGFSVSTDNAEAQIKVFQLYGAYNDVLMGCLKKYGYLIPPKEDKTSLA